MAYRFIIFVVAFALSACSSNKSQPVLVSNDEFNRSTFAKNTPENALKDLVNSINKGKEVQLDFYSPTFFKLAEQSFSNAEAYIKSPPTDIKNAALMSIVTAQKHLEKAHTTRQLIQKNLKQSLEYFMMLKGLYEKVDQNHAFESLQADYTALFKMVENGETSKASREQNAFFEQFAQVEKNLLIQIHLGKSIELIEKAKLLEAAELTPTSFNNAVKYLNEAKSYFNKNYRERETIRKVGLQSTVYSEQAYFYAYEANKIIKLEEEEVESYIQGLYKSLDDLKELTVSEPIKTTKSIEDTLGIVQNSLITMQNDNVNTVVVEKKTNNLDAKALNQVNKHVKPENDINLIAVENSEFERLLKHEYAHKMEDETEFNDDEQSFDSE